MPVITANDILSENTNQPTTAVAATPRPAHTAYDSASGAP